MAAYALFMGQRLAELWRVLKGTGSIYLHCDDTAGHYLRILSDALFVNGRYQNEIVWQRQTSNNAVTSRFGRIADYILFYTKTNKAIWNQMRRQVSAAELREYKQDSVGRYYKTDNLTAPGGRPERQFTWRGATPSGSRSWAYDEETLEAMLAEGSIELGKNGKAKLRGRITYLDANPGQKLQSIWTDVPRVGNTAKERVGYPTQKPLALLDRIIRASSNEGDLVLDPFCGCGTAADAAAKLGRGYLGIDVSAIAVRVMEQRLQSRGGSATPAVYKLVWDDYEWEAFEGRALMHESDAEDGLAGWAWAEDKVAGLLNAVPNLKKVADGGVDARYYTEKGEVLPIQVKMHRGQIGRPDLQKLLGVQSEWQNRDIRAPMSLMVTLYPANESLRVYAAQQGRVSLRGEEYPRMQVLSVKEMLTKKVRPKLPPVDPRYFVGNTQTRMTIG